MTGRRAGSFVCVASSSVIFSEDLPCRMSVEEGEKSFFAASWVLSGYSDFQKGLEERVLKRYMGSMCSAC